MRKKCAGSSSSLWVGTVSPIACVSTSLYSSSKRGFEGHFEGPGNVQLVAAARHLLHADRKRRSPRDLRTHSTLARAASWKIRRLRAPLQLRFRRLQRLQLIEVSVSKASSEHDASSSQHLHCDTHSTSRLDCVDTLSREKCHLSHLQLCAIASAVLATKLNAQRCAHKIYSNTYQVS